jgi:hypothetical protein
VFPIAIVIVLSASNIAKGDGGSATDKNKKRLI